MHSRLSLVVRLPIRAPFVLLALLRGRWKQRAFSLRKGDNFWGRNARASNCLVARKNKTRAGWYLFLLWTRPRFLKSRLNWPPIGRWFFGLESFAPHGADADVPAPKYSRVRARHDAGKTNHHEMSEILSSVELPEIWKTQCKRNSTEFSATENKEHRGYEKEHRGYEKEHWARRRKGTLTEVTKRITEVTKRNTEVTKRNTEVTKRNTEVGKRNTKVTKRSTDSRKGTPRLRKGTQRLPKGTPRLRKGTLMLRKGILTELRQEHRGYEKEHRG